ncbi:MAG: hypothetical protein WCJ95_18750 [Mariniphaga sp.]
MKATLTIIGTFAICVIGLILYLIRKNMKDEKDVTNSFNDKVKTEKKFRLKDDEF